MRGSPAHTPESPTCPGYRGALGRPGVWWTTALDWESGAQRPALVPPAWLRRTQRVTSLVQDSRASGLSALSGPSPPRGWDVGVGNLEPRAGAPRPFPPPPSRSPSSPLALAPRSPSRAPRCALPAAAAPGRPGPGALRETRPWRAAAPPAAAALRRYRPAGAPGPAERAAPGPSGRGAARGGRRAGRREAAKCCFVSTKAKCLEPKFAAGAGVGWRGGREVPRDRSPRGRSRGEGERERERRTASGGSRYTPAKSWR